MEKNLESILEKEVELYKTILENSEIDINADGILNTFGLPIRLSNGKNLKVLTTDKHQKDAKNVVAFRPLKNFSHCSVLIDHVYELECGLGLEEIKHIDENTGKTYYRIEVSVDGEREFTTEKCLTLTEARFKACYTILVNNYEHEEIDTEGIIIDPEKLKPVKQEPKKKKGSTMTDGQINTIKKITEVTGKKFSGKTFNGAQKFIESNYPLVQEAKKTKKKVN